MKCSSPANQESDQILPLVRKHSRRSVRSRGGADRSDLCSYRSAFVQIGSISYVRLPEHPCRRGVAMDLAPHLVFGPFRLDPINKHLWRGEDQLALRPMAGAVLLVLAEHAGEVVTKSRIVQTCLGGNTRDRYRTSRLYPRDPPGIRRFSPDSPLYRNRRAARLSVCGDNQWRKTALPCSA